MFQRFLFRLGVSATICLFSSHGWAEQEKEGFEQESITVTAQKQEQDIQDVPISLSVFGASDLVDRQVDSIAEIAAFTPNLMVFDNGVSGMAPPTVRGMASNVESLTTTSGLYVDGIPVLNGAGFDEMLMDVERVEILKGPQGTLYGKNTEAGVINVISRQPDNETTASAGIKLGEDNTQQYQVSASGPIVKDRLFIGVSGLHYKKDGYIANTFSGGTNDNREHNYGKLQLRATPSDRFSVSAIVSHLKYDDGGANMNLGSGVKNREVRSGLEGYNHASSTMGALKVAYDFSGFKFESVTTSRTYTDDSGEDWDFSPAVIAHSIKDSEYKKVAQEFRLSGSRNRLSWLAGLYMDQDDNQIKYEMSGARPMTVDQDADGESVGIFIHTAWALTDQLSLVSGLRYDREEKRLKNPGFGLDLEEEFSEISPKIALQYRLNPGIMVYGNVAKGYQSGGFNTFAPQGYPTSYDEESLWSYEMGAKTTLFHDRVRLNTSLYYMDIDDMQVETAVNAISNYRSNAAKSTSKGVEVEIDARVTQALSLFASYGYSKITFDSFSDAMGDYKGNTNPYAPAYNYNIGGQYRHQNGCYARVDLNGYGKMYFDKANQFSRDAYSLLNAKVGYEAGSFDLYLYAKNLFDKKYDSDGYYSGYYTIYSPPREIGVSLTWRF